MIQIDANAVHSILNFSDLIKALKDGFSNNYKMPQRHVHHLNDHPVRKEAIALLPSWNDELICTKVFSYFPENNPPLKTLYSNILLFSRKTGESLALIDGTSITYWRTAAVSALVSQFLSKENSETLLLFGNGHLASYLIEAHLSVRKLNRIIISGRSNERIDLLIKKMTEKFPNVDFLFSENLNAEIPQADIICCATGSPKPLFEGRLVSHGTHIDCLGNHSPTQRECDSYTITSSKVYVDSKVNTLAEAGELLIPINRGEFDLNNIVGELSDLCTNSKIHRCNESDISFFKSVGTSLSDLIAAQLVYKSITK